MPRKALAPLQAPQIQPTAMTTTPPLELDIKKFTARMQSLPPKEAFQLLVIQIFATEALPLNNSPEKQKQLIAKFNNYVGSIADAARNRFEGQAIPSIGEPELFQGLAKIFYDNFHATPQDVLLSESLDKDNPNFKNFNCYPASLLQAGVLTELDKEFRVIASTRHILLSGKRWAFETTANMAVFVTFPLKTLDKEYPYRTEGGLELLLAVAYHWSGNKLKDAGNPTEALKYYDTVIEINPNFAGVWYNKGTTHSSMGEFKEALTCYNKEIELNPNDADTLYNTWVALRNLGRGEEARNCLLKMLELEGEDVP